MSVFPRRHPAARLSLPSRRRILRAAAAAVVLAAGIFCFLLYIGLFWGNIRVVEPGRAYRSAQLKPARLSELIQAHGIRTVISLKGGTLKQEWYRRENTVCRRNGASLYQISMSASKLPKPKELRELIRLFDESAYPILFHCKAGSDRTGLAATLYLHLKEGKPLDAAEREGLTWRYGHFPFETVAMDRFFALYRKTARGTDLRTWIHRDYPSIYAEAHPEYRVPNTRTARHELLPAPFHRMPSRIIVR